MSSPSIVSSIPEAASSWKAVIVYIAGVTANVLIAYRVKRNKNLLIHLESLPEADRLPALRAELGKPVYLKRGVTVEEYLGIQRQTYYFRAFIAILITLLAVLGLATYRAKSQVINTFITLIFQHSDEKSALPSASLANSDETPAINTPQPAAPVEPPVRPTQDPPVDPNPQPVPPQPQPVPSIQPQPALAIPVTPAPVNPIPDPDPTPVAITYDKPSPNVAPIAGVPTQAMIDSVQTRIDEYKLMPGSKAMAISILGASGRAKGQITEDIAKDKALHSCENLKINTSDRCYLLYLGENKVGDWPSTDIR